MTRTAKHQRNRANIRPGHADSPSVHVLKLALAPVLARPSLRSSLALAFGGCYTFKGSALVPVLARPLAAILTRARLGAAAVFWSGHDRDQRAISGDAYFGRRPNRHITVCTDRRRPRADRHRRVSRSARCWCGRRGCAPISTPWLTSCPDLARWSSNTAALLPWLDSCASSNRRCTSPRGVL